LCGLFDQFIIVAALREAQNYMKEHIGKLLATVGYRLGRLQWTIPPKVSKTLTRGCVLFLLLVAFEVAGTAANYFETKALPGDGIYSLLRRYKLVGYRCNFDQFYSINRMAKNSSLRVGKTYLLPIEVFAFDGRTIRSSIGQDDWNTAVEIRDYNRDLLSLGLISGAYETTKILLVPYHLLNCADQAVDIPEPVVVDPEEVVADDNTGNPSSSNGRRMFPIFGPEYAYTPLASTKLRGKVFYIVSGHGGPDPGAIGQRGDYRLCEDEYAYDVALRLCRNLIANGATAYMINRDPDDGIRDDKFLICDKDEVVWGNTPHSLNQKVRLTQRSDVINELYNKHRLQGVTDQKVVIIHVDSRSQSQRTDLFFYYKSSSEASQELAQQMHRIMRQKYRQYRANGEYHGTVTSRDLHMLRECEPPSVYVELANIRNIFDQQRIIIDRNRQLLADWMLEGLMGQ
jgi:N-acetylmuramoyl-L-alanine amidase